MADKPKVVVLGALPRAGIDLLRQRFTVEVGGMRAETSWVVSHVPLAVGIVADPSIRVDSHLLDAAGPSLRVISNFGVGYDNIDIEAARRRGIRATNTPDVLTGATAELAVALMLAAGRRVTEADAMVRGGRWGDAEEDEMLGRELAGATVGLVGLGRIAQRVARLLRGFDVRLVAHSRSADRSRVPIESLGLYELLASSDFVSLHVPLTEATRHLIDAKALARVRPGTILVNTSRGGVIDTSALIDALRSGAVGAAGLDVYEDEPYVPAELRELPNTVLLPHLGSATRTTRDAMARLCAENVVAVVESREPPASVI